MVSGGLDTVAVRIPSHPVAAALLREAAVPVAAPSANRSGRPSPTRLAHVLEDLDGRVDLMIDGGECGVGLESTVVSLAGDIPVLLRPGGISLEMLRSVLGEVRVDSEPCPTGLPRAAPMAPGMKYRHYAPAAPLTLAQGTPADVTAWLVAHSKEPGAGILCFDEQRGLFPDAAHVESLGPQADDAAHAHALFDALRSFDAAGVRAISGALPRRAGHLSCCAQPAAQGRRAPRRTSVDGLFSSCLITSVLCTGLARGTFSPRWRNCPCFDSESQAKAAPAKSTVAQLFEKIRRCPCGRRQGGSQHLRARNPLCRRNCGALWPLGFAARRLRGQAQPVCHRLFGRRPARGPFGHYPPLCRGSHGANRGKGSALRAQRAC